MFEKIGGRKFIFIFAMALIASAFVGFGRMDVKEWISFVLAIGAVYITVNQAQK